MENEVSNLKERIKEFAEIAASVPENLQQSCFELLLRDYLESRASADTGRPKKESTSAAAATEQLPEEPPPPTVEDAAKSQSDLVNTDLHVKVRRFMEKHGVTLIELNNLFYKQNDVIEPLYEDVKTTRMSEAQIRVALLIALKNAIPSGEFEAPVDVIRTECRDRKSYDQANFAANFKNNQSLFDGKYGKDTTSIRLSEDGRKELAQLIKELQ